MGMGRTGQCSTAATAVGKQADAHFQARRQLILKVNAQVMLIINKDVSKGLVNGARGRGKSIQGNSSVTVVFVDGSMCTFGTEQFEMRDATGRVIVTRMQVPLVLAWACTIHKSQGLSLDRVKMDLTKCFASGQAYVAVSRARTLGGLQIVSMNSRSIRTDSRVTAYMKQLEQSQATARAQFALTGVSTPPLVALAAVGQVCLDRIDRDSSAEATPAAQSPVASKLRMTVTAPSKKAARFVTAATASDSASEAGSDTEVLAWYALQ